MQLIPIPSASAARWLAALTLILLNLHPATAQDGGGFYVIAKGQNFIQTGAGLPVLRSNDPPFQFLASANPPEDVFLVSATVRRLPDGPIHAMTSDEGGGSFDFKQAFATKGQLDAAFAAGDYKFNFVTGEDAVMPVLRLGGDAYPTNAPRVLNWTALQAADASADIVVTWAPFLGGGPQDYVQFMLEDGNGQERYSSPSPGASGTLNGTNTSFVIPANTLAPGVVYRGQLLFANFVTRNTNAIPDASGVVAYFKETTFELITANPHGTLQFSSPVYTVGEAGGLGTMTVRRVGGSRGQVSVTCASVGGSATSGVDYTEMSRELIFADGETNVTFAVTVEDDLDAEGYETIVLQLSNPTGEAGLGQPATATLILIDDESPASPSVDAYLIAKGQHFEQFGPGAPLLRAELPVNINLSVMPAFPGAVPGATVRLPNGVVLNLETDMYSPELSFEQRFATRLALNALFPSGLYAFTLDTALDGSRTSNLIVPPDGMLYPNAPRVTNLLAAQLIDPAAPFTLEWDAFERGTALDLIRFEARASMGDTLFGSPDFLTPEVLRGTNRSFTIPAGALPPGTNVEGNLTFVRLAGEDTNSYPDVRGLVAFFSETRFPLRTLEAAPPAGRVQFAAPVFRAHETQRVATLTLTRTGGGEGEISVFVGTSNGTATAEFDYVDASGQVSFLPGETNKEISITILDDDLLEGAEGVRLSLRNPNGGAILGLLTNALLVIQEDEVRSAGLFQFGQTNFVFGEGAPAAAITILRVGGKSGEVSVDLSTEDLSAVSGFDYTGLETTVVFSNNVMARTILIPLLNDTLDEANEMFRVSLSNPTGGASLGPRSVATVTIMDNDLGGVVQFGAPMSAISETGGVAVVRVLRAEGGAGDVTVAFAVTGGTAPEEDFVVTNGTLTFGSNVMSQEIFIGINDNPVADRGRTVELTLSELRGGARLGRLAAHTLKILDDEVSLQFARADFTNNEAGPAALITVVRGGPTNGTVSVDYATSDDTADATRDYRATSGTLVFGPGVAQRTFAIILTNDTIAEGVETVALSLSHPTNALLGDLDEATLHLIDNDRAGEISFTTTNYAFPETARAALITIKRAGPALASGVTVHFDASGGTATPDDDYTPVSTNLTFAAGEMFKTIAVPLKLDVLQEPAETVLLTLSEPTGRATLGRSEATLTILNRPDTNAIPAVGDAFLKLALTGVEGFGLVRALNITGLGTRTNGLNPVTAIAFTNTSVANQYLTAVGSSTKTGVVGISARVTSDSFALTSFSVTNVGVFSSIIPATWVFSESTGLGTTASFAGSFERGTIKIDVYQTDEMGRPTVIAGRIEAVLSGPDVNRNTRRALLKGSFRFKP